MASCLKRTRTAIAVFKAIISRTLFALHGFICIWRVTVIKGQPLYWCLTGTIPIMVLETVLTIKLKKGGEWKWICPSVLLYLGTAVPAIWFLELDLMKERMKPLGQQVAQLHNVTNEDAIAVLNQKLGLRISISLGKEEWCKILEQMLLLILIIGRWLLPKGEITREQLSQLLLVYIGMAADIIELFEAFKEDGVRENFMLTLIILSLWTASLMQFTFVLTATKSKRMRPVLIHSGSTASAISIGGKSCCPTEVVSIVISMMLQDGPFLVLRMLLIFRYDVLSYTNLFFTSKNTLVLVLQFYRLLVLFGQKKKENANKVVMSSKDDGLDPETGHFGPDTGTNKGGRKGGGAVAFTSDDQANSSDDEDATGVLNGRALAPRKTPTSARRESFKRQQHAAAESPHTSSEREYDSPPYDSPADNCYTGTPTSVSSFPQSVSDAEVHSVRLIKNKVGRRKVSEDSTMGSMTDSREDVRRGGKKGLRRQRSAKEHWHDVKSLAKAITLVNRSGTCNTLVLKPMQTADNQTVFYLESEHVDTKHCV
ncbi:hypothetical protein BaRGS_00015015 [Batillaria attramentaria]|uniref:Transmembrane protein 26 n=1 Tax=Batillaria attramentaria TaxID=370345 RepID=A0ABD0L362_9CAEN